MNAPEQIIKRIPTKGKPFYTIPVEYVRADLYATQAARIAELEAMVDAERENALRDVANWHLEVAKFDAQGMEYSSLVGVPISNWDQLDTSVYTHEWMAREVMNLASISTTPSNAMKEKE